LDQIIGQSFRATRAGQKFDLIPLPHPSGASPWYRIPPRPRATPTGSSTCR
jgi:uracil-DNA glycosylase